MTSGRVVGVGLCGVAVQSSVNSPVDERKSFTFTADGCGPRPDALNHSSSRGRLPADNTRGRAHARGRTWPIGVGLCGLFGSEFLLAELHLARTSIFKGPTVDPLFPTRF